ncbi:MAG: hypothetical protein HRU75_10320 [Planctomycetia bacterium]|nr:MAG: hypothetical protein HRU75_10320 [Planctomycetia bacterium]
MNQPPPMLEVDESGRVTVDLPCSGCGYSLRMMGIAGVCPECGLGVREGYARHFAVVVTGGVSIRRGARLMALGLILLFFGVLAGLGALRVGGGSTPIEPVVVIIGCLPIVAGVSAVGVGAILTTVRPTRAGVAPVGLRRVTRVAIGAYLALVLLCSVLAALEWIANEFPGLWASLHPVVSFSDTLRLSVLPGLAMLVLWGLIPFVSLCLCTSGIAAGAVQLPGHRAVGITLGLLMAALVSALLLVTVTAGAGGLVVGLYACCGLPALALVSIVYCASLASHVDQRNRADEQHLCSALLPMMPPSGGAANEESRSVEAHPDRSAE